MALEPSEPDPRRLQLRALLKSFADVGTTYFQPPENIEMSFPCTLYKRDSSSTTYADNLKYRHKKRWQITHICRDPDCPFLDSFEALPLCEFDRSFTSDDLNHTVFNLYF